MNYEKFVSDYSEVVSDLKKLFTISDEKKKELESEIDFKTMLKMQNGSELSFAGLVSEINDEIEKVFSFDFSSIKFAIEKITDEQWQKEIAIYREFACEDGIKKFKETIDDLMSQMLDGKINEKIFSDFGNYAIQNAFDLTLTDLQVIQVETNKHLINSAAFGMKVKKQYNQIVASLLMVKD